METHGNQTGNRAVSHCVEVETDDSEAWKRMGVNGGSLVSLLATYEDRRKLIRWRCQSGSVPDRD